MYILDLLLQPPTDKEKIDLSTDDNFQGTAVDTSSSSGFGSANSSIKKSKFSWHTAELFNSNNDF